jgi:hypothetical protein
MTLFEKCVFCHEEQIKYFMKQPCPKCKTIYFCRTCLDSYFKKCSTSCCQCKTKQIDLHYIIHMIQIDYIMMLFNIFLYYYNNGFHNLILCANYLLCTSMLLRVLLLDVRLLDYFNIITNVFIYLLSSTENYFLQVAYFFYITIYITQKM